MKYTDNARLQIARQIATLCYPHWVQITRGFPAVPLPDLGLTLY